MAATSAVSHSQPWWRLVALTNSRCHGVRWADSDLCWHAYARTCRTRRPDRGSRCSQSWRCVRADTPNHSPGAARSASARSRITLAPVGADLPARAMPSHVWSGPRAWLRKASGRRSSDLQTRSAPLRRVSLEACMPESTEWLERLSQGGGGRRDHGDIALAQISTQNRCRCRVVQTVVHAHR